MFNRTVWPGSAAVVAAMCAVATAPAPAAIYTVGAGAGCSDTTIQPAVNKAANNPGLDFIRITRSAAYVGQAIVIQNQDLQLEGAWATCSASSADATRTRVSGSGGSSNSVFSVRGTGAVTFADLEIVEADEVTGSNGYGGGIDVSDGPHLPVRLQNVRVSDNQAGLGGGISVTGGGSANTTVEVVIDTNSQIDNNRAGVRGGGVYCANASVRVIGGARVFNNQSAGTGGGIRAENCRVDIGSGALFPLIGAITLNTAAGSGGGISVTGERSVVNVYSVDPGSPTAINNNVAGGLGGGIDIGSSATVRVYDAIIAANTARSGGGGVSVFDNDGGYADRASFAMQRALDGAPAGARNCDASVACNRISGNFAMTTSDVPRAGAAVLAEGVHSTVEGQPTGYADVQLRGTLIDGNRGESLVRLVDDLADGVIDGAVIVGNVVSGSLLHAPSDGEDLAVRASTIAANAIGEAVLRGYASGFTGLRVERSIVWQPDRALLGNTGSSIDAGRFDYVLVHDLTGIPPSVRNTAGDPRFVDAAAGDFRLTGTSPALDFATGAANQTRDGQPRVIDLTAIPDEFGPQDLGAFERAVDFDQIFADGFD